MRPASFARRRILLKNAHASIRRLWKAAIRRTARLHPQRTRRTDTFKHVDGLARILFAENLAAYPSVRVVLKHGDRCGQLDCPRFLRELSHARDRVHEKGVQAMWKGNLPLARDTFRLASMLAQCVSWSCKDADSRALNQAKSWASYERFRALAPAPIQHVKWEEAGGSGYLHLPAAEGRFPVLILFPDTLSTKETVSPIVDEGLRHGLAVLSVDPPGWGSSGDQPWRSLKAWSAFSSAVVRTLEQEACLDTQRLAVGGMFSGAFWAYVAGLCEPRFDRVCVVQPLIPGMKTMSNLHREDSRLLKHAALAHAGCENESAYNAIWRKLGFDLGRLEVHPSARMYLHSERGAFETNLPPFRVGLTLLRGEIGSPARKDWIFKGGYGGMWNPVLEWLASARQEPCRMTHAGAASMSRVREV